MNKKYIFISIIAILLSFSCCFARHLNKFKEDERLTRMRSSEAEQEQDYELNEAELNSNENYDNFEEEAKEETDDLKQEDDFDINGLSDEDLQEALSRLTRSELVSLESFLSHDKKKRELKKLKSNKAYHTSKHIKEEDDELENDEDDEEEKYERHDKKRFNCKCKNGFCPGNAQKRSFLKENFENDGEQMIHKDPTLINNVNPSFLDNAKKAKKRFSHSDSNAETKIKAKINFLKDKAKRDFNDGSQKFKKSPYTFYEPLVRDKRNVLDDPQKLKESEDPKSPEHIKLLEESFPNPENSFHQSNDDLVRVKRDDE